LYILYFSAKGCSTRTLSLNPNKRNKLSTTLVRGDPTTDPSYVVRVQCRDGYMIKQNYTFIENECLITADSENWIGSWREEGVGCSSKLLWLFRTFLMIIN